MLTMWMAKIIGGQLHDFSEPPPENIFAKSAEIRLFQRLLERLATFQNVSESSESNLPGRRIFCHSDLMRSSFGFKPETTLPGIAF